MFNVRPEDGSNTKIKKDHMFAIFSFYELNYEAL